jgi:hypothetical protein
MAAAENNECAHDLAWSCASSTSHEEAFTCLQTRPWDTCGMNNLGKFKKNGGKGRARFFF